MEEEVDQESKTEDPTPRRREEARRQGRVPFSAELVGGLVLLAGVLGLRYLGPDVGGGMLNVFRHDLREPYRSDLGPDSARELIIFVLGRMLGVLLPLFGLLLAVGVAASVAQVGFQMNAERLGPHFDRLNPATGWTRLFSGASAFKGLLTLLRIAALAGVAYWVISGRAGVVTSIGRERAAGAVTVAWALIMRLALFLSAAVAGVAILDYVYQRRRFEMSLRMTKQELKEELKREEGDPQLKARIRQLQRDRARARMLAEVPKATVVVTNPTHYAVALRYETGRDTAPVVVAKGVGPLARRIAETARNHSVPVLERPTLAQAIYKGVREGQAIPAALFKAVAEVLAFVYQLRGGGPADRTTTVA